MKKKDLLELAKLSSYKENKEEKENEEKWVIKTIFKRIAIIFTIKFFLLLILITVIFIPAIFVLIIIWSFFWSSEDHSINNLEETGVFYNIENLEEFFGTGHIDHPKSIPIEKGRMTYGFDYKTHTNFLTKFLKLLYRNSHEYYDGHRGLDFAPSYQDKIRWYKPIIYASITGVIKRIEKREKVGKNYLYSRLEYKNNASYKTEIVVWKKQEAKVKPYGNNVIISTFDGSYYVLSAHLDQVNPDIIGKININWGNPIWTMWNTGNSTWVHLHYEIRYCWKNNKSLQKNWTQCLPINPLSFVFGKDITYLWISKLPEKNYFTLWVKDKKNIVLEEEKYKDKILNDYEKLCKNLNIILIWSKRDCEEIFPIIVIWDGNNYLLPEIKDINLLQEAWKYHIKKYWNPDNRSLEELWSLYSRWKYNNPIKFYRRDNSIIDNDFLLEDLLETAERINSNNLEEFYNNWFYNPIYLEKWEKNPYVYNFIDKNNIYLKKYSYDGEYLWRYNQYWALKIYNLTK